MPFLMSADDAAAKIARLVERGRSYAVIPWQMALRMINRLVPITEGQIFVGGQNVMDVEVTELRRKIEDNPAQPRIIQTVGNAGYKLTAE